MLCVAGPHQESCEALPHYSNENKSLEGILGAELSILKPSISQ